jgi:hypothetical protein
VEGVLHDRRAEGRRTTNVDANSAPFSVEPDFVGGMTAAETEVF